MTNIFQKLASGILPAFILTAISISQATAQDCRSSQLRNHLNIKKNGISTVYTQAGYPVRHYGGLLYWTENGLEAALANDRAIHAIDSVLEGYPGGYGTPYKRLDTLPDDIDIDKFRKDLDKLTLALISGKTKKIENYKARVQPYLPETPPAYRLVEMAEKTGRCGFGPKTIAIIGQAHTSTATPEDLQQQVLCETAYTHFEAAKQSRPETLFQRETLWAYRYKEGLENGELCAKPPQSLVENRKLAPDPYGPMPSDFSGTKWFKAKHHFDPINAKNPSLSDCKAAYNGTSEMQKRPFVSLTPDEKNWMSDTYRRPTPDTICPQIPARLASWGQEFVKYKGWHFGTSVTITPDECDAAITGILTQDLGGEYLRWAKLHDTLRHPSVTFAQRDACRRMPASFEAQLRPIITRGMAIKRDQAARDAEIQRYRERIAASRPTAPDASISDLLQLKQWNTGNKRCGYDTAGNYMCFDR